MSDNLACWYFSSCLDNVELPVKVYFLDFDVNTAEPVEYEVFLLQSVVKKERCSDVNKNENPKKEEGVVSFYVTTYGRIISLSSWSMMWQCQT
jgi:hypothetical protein